MLVSHDRYLLDRVSTVVIGLDGGPGGVYADYSQWEAGRDERPAQDEATSEEARPAPAAAAPKRKLSYLEQREWDAMEEKIIVAEEELAARQHDLQEAASDANRVGEVYESMQEARRRVDALYARWAELEGKVAK